MELTSTETVLPEPRFDLLDPGVTDETLTVAVLLLVLSAPVQLYVIPVILELSFTQSVSPSFDCNWYPVTSSVHASVAQYILELSFVMFKVSLILNCFCLDVIVIVLLFNSLYLSLPLNQAT